MTKFFGAHVSASGGISKSPSRAKAIGCNSLQFFSASPRVWARNTISQSEFDHFIEEKKKNGIETSVIHAIYLVNLASENPESIKKSQDVIQFDLQVDSRTKGRGVVVHLGSHQGRGWEAVREQVADSIVEILSKTPDDSTFLIENSAEQKGKIASDLSEIHWLLDHVKSKRLGWCLDTCHAHAAGYDILNTKKENGNAKHLFSTIDALDLWDALRVVHVNDSRDPFASGRDRHQNLGDGDIGQSVLSSFLSNEHIQKLPLILEVPGMEGEGPDAVNVERLKKFSGE